MTLRRWFGGHPSLEERVVKALAQARDGELQAAIATISERFPQALAELQRQAAAGDAGWLRLAAWVAYRAGEMPAAEGYAELALRRQEDALTWNLLGRVRIWLKRPEATIAFQHAARLQPRQFVVPCRLPRQRFTRLAEAALAEVPDAFQERLSNTIIAVDDLPDLESVQEGEDPDLLGLYEGATALEDDLPERIVLYQRNHENICGDEAALRREVMETMRHEIGHHFGMTEEDLPY